jgi:magnesium-transporting ATPase (P-type)
MIQSCYKQGARFHPGFACHADRRSAKVRTVKELWEQAILPYNLPVTILLGLVVVFWILTLVGAVSADADLDSGVEDANLGDLPGAMLRIVNAGYVPLTVVLTILILMMWISTLLLNYYFNPAGSLLIALGFFVSAFVLGVIATKVITQPLVPFMRRLKEAENAPPVIGEVGVVRSIRLDSTYGQVEVQRADGAPALLNARLGADSEAVPRGTPVAIISLDEASGVYRVRPLPPTPSID